MPKWAVKLQIVSDYVEIEGDDFDKAVANFEEKVGGKVRVTSYIRPIIE